MSKRTLLTVALCSSLWVCGTHAQERVITVDELFGLCDSCKSTEIAFDALRQAAEGVKAAKGGLTPTLEASLSASFNGDGYVIDRDFGGAMKAEIPHFGNSFVLKAMQVIYAGGAIDAGIKQARIGEKIAEKRVEMTKQNGQLIQPGQTVANIVESGEKWIIANYKETQTANIKPGCEVEIEVDAVSDVKFKGVVRAISDATGASFSLVPTDNSAGNFVKVEQRIPVRIDFTDANSAEDVARLRSGMNAECKIIF